MRGLSHLLLSLPLGYYIWKRCTHICSGFAIFFLLCECIVLLCGAINIGILVEGIYSKRSRRIEENITDVPPITFSSLPDVPHILIIIPTYHEGWTVLERTLQAVEEIIYPREKLTIVVGDDGHNQDIQQHILEEYPFIHYHCRQNIFGHAKAGNLNDILQQSYPGDYVLVLDCDMAPRPEIIMHLLPLFYQYHPETSVIEKNLNCAFVQSPQHFNNIESYDFLGQHYVFFYYIVLVAWNEYQCGVPCCGTNVLFSRSHLSEIHGFQFGSITEDFKTSLKLHSRGYHSKYYHASSTAVGYAPLSFLDFYHQRQRWTVGGLEIFFSSSFSHLCRLPWPYAWLYGFASLSPFLSFFLGVLILGPLINLGRQTSSVLICDLDEIEWAKAFAPYILLYTFFLLYLHAELPLSVLFRSIQETIFMTFINWQYLMTFILKRLRAQKMAFRITPKMNNPLTTAMCSSIFFILLPYLIYMIYAIYLIIWTLYEIRTWTLDLTWTVIILWQMYPPLFYFLYTCQT